MDGPHKAGHDESESGLVLSKLPEIRHIGEAGIDIARIVHRHRLNGVVFAPGDEADHLAVADMAEANAILEPGIVLGAGQRIGDIDHVALDEETAGPAELPPFGQERALLVEYLDAAVGAVGDI